MKRCRRCKVIRPVDAFAGGGKGSDGLQRWCKPCFSEYSRLRKPVLTERACKGCGVVFLPAQGKQVFCVKACGHRWHNRQAPRSRLETVCRQCGGDIPLSRHGTALYCTRRCSALAHEPLVVRRCEYCLASYQRRGPPGRCPECIRRSEASAEARREARLLAGVRVQLPPGPCSPRVRPKLRVFVAGFCLECGDPFVTAQTGVRFCTSACGKRADRRVRRRRWRAASVGERVYALKVFERDGWACRLCGDAVDRFAKCPEPLSPSLDHVVPLARGGEHSYANVQLAHFACNVAKGASLPA